VPYAGLGPTKFGRVQSAPPPHPWRLHLPGAVQLGQVKHEVPIPVLDQEDLIAQKIDTSQVVPGAQRVDALGSCTCNAGTAHLAERWAAAGKDLSEVKVHAAASRLDSPGTAGATGLSAEDAAADEMFAILLYHLVTDQTGNPSSEWPPADCGSSGYYVCTELERQGLARTYKTASGAVGAMSLLQAGTVMLGMPWFMAWESPDSRGFIDGDGSQDALQAALASGVAGGHETLMTGIEQLALTSAGAVDLASTVIRVRNSWSPQWGPLGGDYLVHASTLDLLSAYTDYKAIVV
jgi:hypothetical protein